ncbi:iron-sulfur cluster assembly 1 homolog, mitochondrial-like [Mya arenaria]|uniref:iron-sulfur cluster assembly 1 homolog, mitochondrial-like n=1 Tax=Mya arenaria TaxID=6604 RepID=UPI0022E570A6|nr:iron-sulfur cluster assembly 1 homolog, mitochondrial-like [Mya arenaria]XP_052776672.1 iron-sulfur cluster assembly 1 homolog, mitochondrial-like [Mya arenaria]
MASKLVGATVRAVARKRTMIPTKAPLVLTQSAVAKVKELMHQKPETMCLKIGVKTRGCNGLTYTLDYCDKTGKFDEVVEQEGAKIVIDAKAQLTLLGTEMDYVEDKLAAEFVFNNPNIKGTCGCGESFNV